MQGIEELYNFLKDKNALSIKDYYELGALLFNILKPQMGIKHNMPLLYKDLQDINCYGSYNIDFNSITFNTKFLNQDNFADFLLTICHELRHCSQAYEIKHSQSYTPSDINCGLKAVYYITKEYGKNYARFAYYGDNDEIDAKLFSTEMSMKLINELKEHINSLNKNDNNNLLLNNTYNLLIKKSENIKNSILIINSVKSSYVNTIIKKNTQKYLQIFKKIKYMSDNVFIVGLDNVSIYLKENIQELSCLINIGVSDFAITFSKGYLKTFKIDSLIFDIANNRRYKLDETLLDYLNLRYNNLVCLCKNLTEIPLVYICESYVRAFKLTQFDLQTEYEKIDKDFQYERIWNFSQDDLKNILKQKVIEKNAKIVAEYNFNEGEITK